MRIQGGVAAGIDHREEISVFNLKSKPSLRLVLVVLSPSFPHLCEFGGFLRSFLGQVIRLGWVCLEVVQFPGFTRPNHFQVALPDGVGTAEVPVDFLVGFALFSLEDGEERLAERGLGLVAQDLLGVLRSGDVPKGCGNVDDVADLVGHPRLDDSRPMSDEGRADASLVVGRLELAVGSIACVGPTDRDRAVAFDGARRNIRGGIGLLGACPVVGQEHDEGVVPLAQFLDLGKEPAEVLVDPVDHGGVDRHLEVLGILLFLGQVVPCLGGPRGEFVVRADDAHLVHPLEALLTDLVPADLVLAPVLCDVLGPGVERVVGRRVGQVENEGLVLVFVFV